jgi:hypothetical protein
MFKAEKFIKIYLAVVLFFLVCIGDSFAKTDCDGGYGNTGPTVPEDFTPLPDPEIAPGTTFVVVALNVGDKLLVWDPEKNWEALIRNAADTGWVSFPCALSDIQHWLDTTTAVSTNSIYDWGVVAGDDNVLIHQCDYDTSSNTGCGTLTCKKTDNSTGCVDIEPDYSRHCDISYTLEHPAILKRLGGISYNLPILTNAGGTTCFRTSLEIDYEYYEHTDPGPDYDLWRREYRTYTIHTPIGDMDSSTLEHYGRCQDCINYYSKCDSVQYVDTERSILDGYKTLFSDNVMVQIYYSHYRVEQEDSNYYQMCGYGNRNIENTYTVMDPKFIAACNYYANGNAADQNPTSQNRNTKFEGAIKELYNSGPPDIMHRFNMSMRKKN